MEGISGVKSQGITKAALTRERIWEALEEMKVEDRNEFYIEGHKCSMDDVEKINDSLIQEIKSKNNTITIEKGKFYGVRGADGRKWAMRINKNGDFHLMHSESLYAWDHGEKCKELSGRSVSPHSRSRLKWSIRPRWKWTGSFKNTGSAMDFLRSAWENAAIPFSTAERERYTQSRIMTTATGSTGKENRRYFPMGQIIWI